MDAVPVALQPLVGDENEEGHEQQDQGQTDKRVGEYLHLHYGCS